MEHKKFTEAEILVGLLFLTLPVDGIAALIDWTGVGLVFSPILQSAAMFATWLWLRSKGDTASLSLGKQLLRYLSNALPLLPTVTAVFIIEVYLHNHPQTGIAKVAQGASALKAGRGATGGIRARAAAAQKAYREAPTNLKEIEAMERERAGGKTNLRFIRGSGITSPSSGSPRRATGSSETGSEKDYRIAA